MAVLMPEQMLALSGQTADKLLEKGDGDAALFYLALLRRDGDEGKARAALRWTQARADGAMSALTELGLARRDGAPERAPAQPPEQPPDYLRADLLSALEHESGFRGLYQAVESVLGAPMSDTDLKSLYTIYDYLSLPPEVILTLANYCLRECERKYGPGRRPRMVSIKKEAFAWKRLGIDTAEAAEEFLQSAQKYQGRESELLPLLGIRGRAATDPERKYLSEWVSMGFDNESIALAYERTVFQKQNMNWPYMNSILKNWHKNGLHTVAAVKAEDRPPQRPQHPAKAPAPRAGDREKDAGKLRDDLAELQKFVDSQKK